MSTPETKRDRTVLNIKENHILCNWLMESGNIRAGDTFELIATRAREQLGINRVNKDHIYTRMAALELTIPAEVDADEELLQDVRDLRQLVLSIIASGDYYDPADAMMVAAFKRLEQRSGV